MPPDPVKLDYAPPPKPIALGAPIITLVLFVPATIGGLIATIEGVVGGVTPRLLILVDIAMTTLAFLMVKGAAETIIRARRNRPE
jgi:hypothetical protein